MKLVRPHGRQDSNATISTVEYLLAFLDRHGNFRRDRRECALRTPIAVLLYIEMSTDMPTIPQPRLILASGSATRREMLEQAAVAVEVVIPSLDEPVIKASLIAEGLHPRDIADALAEAKARRVSAAAHPGSTVLGADQVLAFDGRILSKPPSTKEARAALLEMRGKTHELFSAAVIYNSGRPVWRHVARARLTMREFSEAYLDSYLERNWESVRHSVGGYKIEEEGVRLFARVEGDHFTILGMPLVEILSYLALRGTVPG